MSNHYIRLKNSRLWETTSVLLKFHHINLQYVVFVSVLLFFSLASGLPDEIEAEMDTDERISPGATEVEVRNVMGIPTKTNILSGGIEYVYGYSRIKFVNGRMVQWYPVDKLIPVFMADRQPDAPSIVVGATTNDVLNAMGTPSGLTLSEFPRKQEIWLYGASSIMIVNGKVESWSDAWNLVVSPKTVPSKPVLITSSQNPTGSPSTGSTTTESKTTVLPRTTVVSTRPAPISQSQQPIIYPSKPATVNSSSSDRVYVRGYTRKDGTYVRPHTRSRPKR